MQKLKLSIVFLLTFFLSIGIGYAQNQITLRVCDLAPELKYSKWIKGNPVSSLNGDKIYVVEFWATWCGPCIAAMPHLSELQEKYKEQAVFIGCNVWEGAHSSEKKKYEDYLPSIMRFVNSSANRMSYNVIADNNEEEMSRNWLRAAGLEGIPQTFVIKNGKVLWIGNPVELDKVMDGVVKGTFDISVNKKESEAKASETREMAERIRAGYTEVQQAEAAKNYDLALKLAEENAVKVPQLQMVLKVEKMKILFLAKREKEALEYGRELSKQNGYATMVGSTICDENGYSKDAYLLAAESFLSVKQTNCLILDKAALSYSKAGDFKAAVETQQKAVELAKIEVKDPKFGGRVFDYTITDFEAKVKAYQEQIK
ncbi:TlpA family protein disulfide reductase [Pinibacter aurantiacus]|uniref:TlpA family protein disulfide reductase n=1 Tax=Pinibacter aurantiacus TaxID=2851599 RepID=A0A9E2S9U1_9BACT|nr:TlpA disulfide reductase family protein [Pinibacter aurantiacus]MBV4357299.1 TlpA family protein disulfide reductase [Pinibacter aurantiacus]